MLFLFFSLRTFTFLIMKRENQVDYIPRNLGNYGLIGSAKLFEANLVSLVDFTAHYVFSNLRITVCHRVALCVPDLQPYPSIFDRDRDDRDVACRSIYGVLCQSLKNGMNPSSKLHISLIDCDG